MERTRRSVTGSTALAVAALLAVRMPAAGAPVQGISLIGAKRHALSAAALRAAVRAQTHGTVSADHRTLTVHGKAVRLVVTTGPENDMLSYRVAGLRNPTLVVDKGSTVRMLFVNTDEDMFHSLRLTKQRAPFPDRLDVRLSVGSPDLPHQTKAVRHGSDLTFRAAPGRYTYVCTVRGHARAGMYGQLVVR